uniref:CFEM domain-containing protein n=1 Tax=Ascaris lumbricoides TaxID=6252 RepID=A0A0M3IBB2_ASCLU
MQDCSDGCRFSCYAVDHCNDSDQSMIACAPDIRKRDSIADSVTAAKSVVMAVKNAFLVIAFFSPLS